MKKFFALVLAAVMVLSLAAVSFADYTITTDDDVKLVGTFVYDADKNAMELTSVISGLFMPEDNEVNTYGKPVYFLLMGNEADAHGDRTTLNAIHDSKYVEKLKYKVELESGMEIIRGISIVKKYIDVDATWDDDGVATTYMLPYFVTMLSGNYMESGYYYFAEVIIADKETTADTDVIGTVKVSRKADKKENIVKIDDVEFDFAFNVFYKNAWINQPTVFTIENDKADLEWDTNYALKFECDDEVEFSFGSANNGNNEGTFTVDVSGQGKVILNYNTNPVEAIADANPGVDMDFINFNNVKFNRVGEFVYEMENIAAAYKIVDGQLVAINGAEFDSDSVTFNTRVLESYVFATAELVNPAPVAA